MYLVGSFEARKNGIFGRFFFLLIVISIIFSFGIPGFSQENLTERKLVKVGYFHSTMFMEGMSDLQMKGGYGYEYLQKVADYSGWQYEYVYGEWADLLELLEKGQIDVLAGVSISPERQNNILFPNYSMGVDRYYLYQHVDKQLLIEHDYSTFKNVRIGSIKNNRMTWFLQKWAEENNVKLRLRLYDGFAERDQDFYAYSLDAILASDSNVQVDSGMVPVMKIGEEPYYLCVNINRPDLLADLNQSLEIMNEMEPYFIQAIQNNYYGNTLKSNSLSDIEDKWVNNHEVLRVGYLKNYLPYCDIDSNGNPTGLFTDVLEAISVQLKLEDRISIEYVCYENSNKMIDALNSDDIDVIFPVGGGTWFIENSGLSSSSPVVTSAMDLVYKGNYDEKTILKIAYNKNNLMQSNYCSYQFPYSTLLPFNSDQDCLNAVDSGKASCAVISGLRLDLVVKNKQYNNFHTVQLEKTDSRSFGVKSGNYPLLLLLNRGLKVIGRDFGINASYSYVNEVYEYTVLDFINQNASIFMFMFVIILGIIIFLLVIIIQKILKESQEKERFLKEIALARQDTIAAMLKSNTDELTGFYNRRAYETDIREIEDKMVYQTYTIVSIDINGLKEINDSLGHNAGDELITGAAQCMKEKLGHLGKLYRVGGDEFVLIAKAEENIVKECIEDLKVIAKEYNGTNVHGISFSHGIASSSHHKNFTPEQLLVLADKRMYETKSLFYSNRKDRRNNEQGAYTYILDNYIKILKIDLHSDSYLVVKMEEEEKERSNGFSSSLFKWMKNFADKGYISSEDLKRYYAFTDAAYIRQYFKSHKNSLAFNYERKVGGEFVPVTMEIIPANDINNDRQEFFLYVRKQ